MNSYCKYIIEDFSKMFKERNFEQKDVINFIMTIREYQKNNSNLRELGDFIAHMVKDRGETINLIKKNSEIFNIWIDNHFSNNDNNTPIIFSSLDTRILANELNEVLEDKVFEIEINNAINNNSFIEEKSQSFKEFIFCIIMFLSSCRVKIWFNFENGKIKMLNKAPRENDKKKCSLKELLVYIKYGGVIKSYISFDNYEYGISINTFMPILSLRNSNQNGFEKNEIRDFYAKRFENGILSAVSYSKIGKEVVEEDKFPCLLN